MAELEVSTKALEQKLREIMGIKLGKAAEVQIRAIISDELPGGTSSSIAHNIELKEKSTIAYQVQVDSRVWIWLNDGTGIYSSEHRGAGPGGEIVPTGGAKTLHFKNAQLARALGFKDENVFLRSVKGIEPRFFWDRYFDARIIGEKMASTP